MISYNRLWKLLIDKNMTKTQLCQKAHITTNVMAKMGRNEMVKLEALVKICNELGCTMDDIIEIFPDTEQEVG